MCGHLAERDVCDGLGNVGIWCEWKHCEQREKVNFGVTILKKNPAFFFFMILQIFSSSKVSLMCRRSDYLEQVSVSPSFIHWHWRGFFSSPKQSGSPLIEQMLTPNNLPPEILDLMLPVQKNNKIKQNKKEILDPHRPHAASYWL